MTEAPKVEQVDREAAFNLFQAVNGGNNPLLRSNYLSGFFDNTNEVIAFARHRELATLTEPERTAKAVAEAVETLIYISETSDDEHAAQKATDSLRRIAAIRASLEGREGVASFLEKRKPTWLHS